MSTIYTIFTKGFSGIVIGFMAMSMFWAFKKVIDPSKMNHQEFGKHTDLIGVVISSIFMFCCLIPLFGFGFYK